MDTSVTIRVGNAVYRHLMDPILTAEDIRKARDELKETPEGKIAGLKILKEKLKNDTDLVPRLDDEFLVRFLRTRKYNVDRAYNLVKDYYRFRAKHSVLFPRPSDFEKTLRANMFNYLRHRDSKGRGVLIMRIGLWEPEKHNFKEFVSVGNMLSELLLENEVTQINGYVGIWDFKDYGFQHFYNSCTPRLMWLLCSLMQDCFPGRFKCAYCVNSPPLADTVWKLFKPLLKEKYRKRVLVFGNNWPLLHKYIHPSILPSEYGGELPSFDCTDIVNKVIANDHVYEYNKSFGYKNRNKDHHPANTTNSNGITSTANPETECCA